MSTHAGIQNIAVTLYNSADAVVASASTAADGTYIFSGVAPGNYTVGFSGSGYVSQFYDGKSSLAIADPVSAIAGSATTGIDAAMQAGGQITGTVRNTATKRPIQHIAVVVYDGSGNELNSACTAADGTYTVSELATGSYRVGFDDGCGVSKYVPQFYNGKSSLASADPISVTAGSVTSGIDAAMQAGGQITGRVTDAVRHAGIVGVSVSAYDSSGTVVGTPVTTKADGTYSIPELATGSYRVGFVGSGYLPQFYKGESSLAGADPISVTAGSTTAGIDAAMHARPQIVGTVINATTQKPIKNAEVTLYNSADAAVASTSTTSDGTYALSGVAVGPYEVGFSGDGYLPQFYNGKSSLASADPVSVTAGSTTTGIDAALLTSTGQISGKVTAASTGKPIQKIDVSVYDGSGNQVNSACTAADGTYTVSELASGSYRVGFSDGCGASDHLPQFYNGKSSLASADQVSVAAGATTTGIDAAMQNRPLLPPPVNRIAPTVVGTTTLGKTLTATAGTWSQTSQLTYAYEWQRCTPSCADIPGAADSSYTLLVTDLGAKIRVVVAAINADGYALAASAQVGSVAPSRAQIKSLLLAEIVPSGKDAAITAVLRNRGYWCSCSALSAGPVVISWYWVQSGAQLVKAKPKPVLVATGRRAFKAAGKALLKIKLTTQGKHLLKHAKKLKLTAKATFTPGGQPALGALTTFTLPPPPITPTPPAAEQFGANVNRLFDDRAYTRAQIDSQLQALHDTGATIARSDAMWEFSEPTAPVGGVHRYDWTFDDLIAGSLAAQGLRWLPIIDYAPAWAQLSSGKLHSPPRSPGDYAFYAAALAARYGPNGAFWRSHPGLSAVPVETYEIWNEPDNGEFWEPSPDPGGYAALYLLARGAIKAVDPTAAVIVGGLMAPAAFAPAMLAARPDARKYIDGVAIHPYGPNPQAVLQGVLVARHVLTRLGLATVPLYVTEFGWTTLPIGARSWLPGNARAGYISETLSELGHVDCGLAATLIYTWMTPGRDPGNPEDWFGIHPQDGPDSPDTNAFAAGLRTATQPGATISLCSASP